MRLALFQPDIAQNTGTILRLAACLAVAVDIIEPCGFVWHDRHFKRAGLDYLDHVELKRHESWARFLEHQPPSGRIVLMTTKAAQPYTDFNFQADDILLAGSESTGVPDYVHEKVDAAVTIPMQNNMRSLNVGLACAMVLGEAQRQIGVL